MLDIIFVVGGGGAGTGGDGPTVFRRPTMMDWTILAHVDTAKCTSYFECVCNTTQTWSAPRCAFFADPQDFNRAWTGKMLRLAGM